MDGSIPEVDELLRMTNRPAGVPNGIAFMSIVGRGGDVATLERIDHRAVSNSAGPSPIALLSVFSIPIRRRRQPDGEPDARIRCRPDDPFDLAVHRYLERRRIGGASRRA